MDLEERMKEWIEDLEVVEDSLHEFIDGPEGEPFPQVIVGLREVANSITDALFMLDDYLGFIMRPTDDVDLGREPESVGG